MSYAVHIFLIVMLTLFVHSQRYLKSDSIDRTFLKLILSHASPSDSLKIIRPLGLIALFIWLIAIGSLFFR